MNNHASEYIKKVLEQIKFIKVHNSISEELHNHILELTEELVAKGMDEEGAYKEAVLQMGDPVEVGKRLHKTHKPKPEWSILILLAMIVGFGFYIIYFYSTFYSVPETFRRQLIFGLLGLPVLLAFYFFDYTRFEKYTPFAYYFTCVLMFAAIIFVGSQRNGRAYINIGDIGFSPSFAAIPILLISYAGLVKRWCDGKMINLIKLIFSAWLPLLAILMEPALANFFIVGTGLLAMITCGICTNSKYRANRNKTILLMYICLFFIGLLLFIHYFVLRPWKMDRLTMFLHPERDPLGEGWIYTILGDIFNSAKLIGGGSSFLDSRGKAVNLLPCANSEYILTFVIGSLGWIFGIALIVFLSLIVLRLFITAGKINNTFGKYICVGVCCIFSLQVILNVLMALRLIPVLGVSLPFISAGGTAYLLNMVLIGLFLGIYRRKDLVSFQR